ncbi:hypothetical protein MN0502_24120 [Arthrobacter sp. MN05-02]|nr:hypothetical protein MN0502_24120 [Arthrobacter sp. MN05-02]
MCAATMKLVVTGGIAVPAEDGFLGRVVREQFVRAEAVEIERLRRVGGREREPGGQDLLPGGVALAPEGGAPRRIERIEIPVASTEPAAERLGGDIAVAQGVVAPDLVGDVPDAQGGVAAVARGHLLHEGEGMVPVDGGAGAEGLAAAGPADGAVGCAGEDLGMRRGQPGGSRRRPGAEVHADPVLREQVHHRVEVLETEDTLLGFQFRPAEDVDGDQVDAGLLHQPDVLVPHGRVPLLGVVVAPIHELS